jgi:chromosome segregation ATPase
MAADPPSKVTSEGLSSLAKLCLCRDYHSSQRTEVVERWTTVIERATQHYKQLAGGNSEADADRLANLLLERQKCLRLLDEPDDSKSDLRMKVMAHLRNDALEKREAEAVKIKVQKTLSAVQNDLIVSREHSQALEEKLRHMELGQAELTEEHRSAVLQLDRYKSELSSLTDVLEEANNNRKALRTSAAVLQTDFKNINQQLDEARSSMSRLEGGKVALESRLTEANGKIESNLTQLEKARQDNKTLRSDYSSALNQLGRLQTDLGIAEEEIQRLKQSQTECQGIRRANSKLAQEKSILRGRIAALEEDISSCWLHRFRVWISRRRAIS